eukprot:CAMPEP_0174334204 /NCGR_PEP_ID=MMETSP0810-20121108/19744_1 /TAXON_ID=73025 ORGANISM="Eutreptiella gymnastica-like, Strain CCMP1594" /NCGR_SAMPLE_ID=MMETSP0810 /ASSEMBLY_ACC=CAM_ASM_000659 /LENGTH=30 /DNA_ID= /DNA_START= /DNA_END= /DNA_ORIENTATION=
MGPPNGPARAAAPGRSTPFPSRVSAHRQSA